MQQRHLSRGQGYICRNLSFKHMREVWGNGQKNMSLEVRYSADGETFRWAEVNAMLFRREDMPDKVYLAMQDTSEQHLLKGIVGGMYAATAIISFISMPGITAMSCSAAKGTVRFFRPITVMTMKAIETYVRKYIAPEDQELAICEMRISRVLEELDRTGGTLFLLRRYGLSEGYTRKRLQYLYYDKREPDGADDKDRCHGHLSGTEASEQSFSKGLLCRLRPILSQAFITRR